MSKIQNFIDEIMSTDSEAETIGVTDRFLQSRVGPSHHILFESGLTWHLPKGYVGTYSEDWMQLYFRRNYHYHDPITQRSMESMEPFRWSDIGEEHIRSRKIMTEAAEFELNEGYCFPVAQNGYYSAAVSIAGEEIEIPKSEFPELQLAMIYYHGRVLSFQTRPPITHSRDSLLLTRRESECLALVARGKTDKEIGDILEISDTTVHGYIESAKKKLSTVSRTQAVVEALKLGLIAV